MNKSVLVVLMSISLTSCLGVFNRNNYYKDEVVPFLETLEEDYRPQVVDGVMEPSKFPDLDEDQETLLGIDSNNDGVRDDVEIFINRKFKYDYERETEKVFFRHAQVYLKNAKSMTREQLKRERNQFHADTECYRYYKHFRNFPISIPSGSFDGYSIAFNTKERREVFRLAINSFSPGEDYGSGVSTYNEAFEYCSDLIKKRYPNIQNK